MAAGADLTVNAGGRAAERRNSEAAPPPTHLLTDCGENQTWNHYAEFLSTLWEAELSEEDFLPPS